MTLQDSNSLEKLSSEVKNFEKIDPENSLPSSTVKHSAYDKSDPSVEGLQQISVNEENNLISEKESEFTDKIIHQKSNSSEIKNSEAKISEKITLVNSLLSSTDKHSVYGEIELSVKGLSPTEKWKVWWK